MSEITLSEILEMYAPFKYEGAIQLLLNYQNDTLKVCVLMTDDCEPYWDCIHKQKCSLNNWAKLMYHVHQQHFITPWSGPFSILLHWA